MVEFAVPPGPVTMKGAVESWTELPDAGAPGDAWVVTHQGTHLPVEFVWSDGRRWWVHPPEPRQTPEQIATELRALKARVADLERRMADPTVEA